MHCVRREFAAADRIDSALWVLVLDIAVDGPLRDRWHHDAEHLWVGQSVGAMT